MRYTGRLPPVMLLEIDAQPMKRALPVASRRVEIISFIWQCGLNSLVQNQFYYPGLKSE
jgi:hypothetical protein